LVVVVDDVDIEPVAGAAAGGVVVVVVVAAGAEASAGAVVVVVAEASAAGGVVAAGAAESVAVVVVVVAASSAFLAQADRLRARPAATATEVMIRMFMELLPWRTMEDDPPTMDDSYTGS
jgi:hypothetical protein